MSDSLSVSLEIFDCFSKIKLEDGEMEDFSELAWRFGFINDIDEAATKGRQN